MATGTYGTIHCANLNLEDVSILCIYRKKRSSETTKTFKLDPIQVMEKVFVDNKEIDGLYNLKLPTELFQLKGFYTILFRPIEIEAKIVDCGVLSNFPDVRGIVIDTSTVDSNYVSKFGNNNLVGYRIYYLNNTGSKIPNLFRIITSNNYAEVITGGNDDQTITQKYVLKNTSNLVFCTVTPNSASESKPNVLPYIGNPGDRIILTNTYFDPVMLEIELVEHDIETLAYGIYGNISKSFNDGIYTVYNFENEIYAQWDIYEIKDAYGNNPLYEIKERRKTIDFTKQFNNVILTD